MTPGAAEEALARRYERVSGLRELERAHDSPAVVRMDSCRGSRVALTELRVGRRCPSFVVERSPSLARAESGSRRQLELRESRTEVEPRPADDERRPAGGKDRTGLLSAFLLQLAGVESSEIAADYGLSEERLRPRHEAWFEAAESEEDLERLRRIAQTPAASMVGVFAELERRYGGVEAYLRDAGVTDEELELVRERLLG